MLKKALKHPAGSRSLNIPALLIAAIFEPGALRLGISGVPGTIRYALVNRRKDGTVTVIGWGDQIPFVLRCIMPIVACADTGSVPLYLFTEQIGNDDPDQWIDRNDKRIIPTGFSVEQIVTEYEVAGPVIIAASATAGALAAHITLLEKLVQPNTILPALQGLANVFRDIGEPLWIVWKIERQGSVLGRVEHGRVVDICHFWAGSEAIAADNSIITRDVVPLVKSLGRDHTTPPLVCFAPGDQAEWLAGADLPGRRLLAPTVEAGIPRQFLEAYGNALATPEQLSLLPFHKRQLAVKQLRSWNTMMYGIRLAAAILLLTISVAGSYIGINRFLIFKDQAATKQVNEHFRQVRSLIALRDSLTTKFRGHLAFSAGESAVTRLLNDLQQVFPEGMCIEEFAVVERDAAGWRLSLRAFALSAGLVQPTIGSLAKVDGISNVRMVYSEQAGENGRRKGLRVKIEADWQ